MEEFQSGQGRGMGNEFNVQEVSNEVQQGQSVSLRVEATY